MGACTMDIIAAIAFGTKVDSQRNPDEPFVTYAKKVNGFSIKNFGFLFVGEGIISFCKVLISY